MNLPNNGKTLLLATAPEKARADRRQQSTG
jgi:hypothetical protein